MFLRHGGSLLLAGISLVAFTFFVPDADGHQETGAFFKMATDASWGKLLDLPAAWCSFKIILLSLGLFLTIESLGTILSLINLKPFARLVGCLHLAPGLGVLVGGYYLIKALL